MNKQQFIEAEIAKNKQRFGRWASTTKRDSPSEMKLLFEEPPQNEEEVLQHCNALFSTGDYGICTDGCFNVGIAGVCGPDCFVYKNVDCPEPGEIEVPPPAQKE